LSARLKCAFNLCLIYIIKVVCVKQYEKVQSAIALVNRKKCGLHPLIHTFIELNLAHNAVGGQINAVKKPPLTRPASRGFKAARMEHTSP
jgi:hypothetical protein